MRTLREREKLFFWLLFAVCTAARIAVSVFPKTGAGYPGELYNLELAQNIWLRGRLTVYARPVEWQGVLYPLALSPCYTITDPEIRMAVISVLNAMLVSSALIPAWLISRRILKKSGSRLAAVLLFALMSWQWFSVTLMRENLYIHLAMWGCLLLVRAFEKGAPGLLHSALLGAAGGLMLLTTEAGAVWVAGALGTFIYQAAAEKRMRKALAGGMVFLCAACAVYLPVNAALCGSVCWYPVETGAGILDSHATLLYWMVSGFCLFLYFAAGLLFYPVIVPAAYRKETDDAAGRLFRFGMYAAVFAALLTAGCITLPADFARTDIRVMLRWFIALDWILIPPFMAIAEKAGKEKADFRHAPVLYGTLALAVLAALLLRIPEIKEVTDATGWLASGWLGEEEDSLLALRLGGIALLVTGAVLWTAGKKKWLAGGALVLLMAFGVTNGILFLNEARKEEAAPQEEIRLEVKELDRFLREDGEGEILVVRSWGEDPVNSLADAYCSRDYYILETDELTKAAMEAAEPGIIRFRDADLPDEINKIVFLGTSASYAGNAAAEEITPEGMSVARIVRNTDPGTIDLRKMYSLGFGQPIFFQEDSPDFLSYPHSGLSSPERGFTWSDGKEVTLTIRPETEGSGAIRGVWSIASTLGQQKCRVYANDILLFDGRLEGRVDLVLRIPQEAVAADEMLTFRFEIPDAKQPDNGDTRTLGISFESFYLQDTSSTELND